MGLAKLSYYGSKVIHRSKNFENRTTFRYDTLRSKFYLFRNNVHCTVVKKGNIIQILDYELGVFSETLELEKNWTKRIFGLSLHKKKF